MADDTQSQTPNNDDPLYKAVTDLTQEMVGLKSVMSEVKDVLSKSKGGDRGREHIDKAFGFMSSRGRSVMASLGNEFKKIPFGDMMFKGIENKVANSTKLKSFFTLGDKLYGSMSGIALLIAASLQRWLKLDAAAESFRKATGVSASQMTLMRAEVERINIEFKGMGIKAEDVYKSAAAFVEEFKSIGVVTSDMMKVSSLLAANYAVSEKTTAGVYKNLVGIGGKTQLAAKNMIATAVATAKLTGLPVNKVMDDLASSAEDVYLATRGIPENMLRASIHARSLGLSLDEMTKTTGKLLNFQESIDAELNASVLLNRQLNLMEARRLAFMGDSAGALDEIVKQMDKIGDLNKLNPIQMKAFADATGMSIEQLTRLNATRQIERDIMSSGTAEERKRLETIVATRKALQASLDVTKQTGEEYLRQQEMQSVQAQLVNGLKELWLDISEILLPIVSFVMMILRPIVAFLKGVFTPLKTIASSFRDMYGNAENFEKRMQSIVTVAEFLGKVIGQIFMIVNFFTTGWIAAISKGAIILAKIVGVASKFFSVFKSVAMVMHGFSSALKGLSFIGSMFKFIGLFSKWIPIVGWIIMGVQAVFEFFRAISNGKGVMEALGDTLWNTLIKPFIDAWAWLKSTFVGNSPSELGLGIVDGIKSVGGMLFDALFWPFKTTWELIKGLFSGKNFGEILTNMFNALPAPLRWAVDKLTGGRLSAVRPEGSSVEAGKTIAQEVAREESAKGTTNDIIAEKLDELIGLLRDGAIGVNIDGKKASQLISQRT